NVAADGDRINPLIINVTATETNLTLEAETADEVVHAIDAAQHRAFAAAGGTDKGCDSIALDREMCVAHGLEITVMERVQLDIDDRRVAIACPIGLRAGGW